MNTLKVLRYETNFAKASGKVNELAGPNPKRIQIGQEIQESQPSLCAERRWSLLRIMVLHYLYLWVLKSFLTDVVSRQIRYGRI